MDKPWEQLPDETSQEYAWFRKYRDYGRKRSVKKVKKQVDEDKDCDLTSISVRQLQKYCSKHNWVERAEAWETNKLAQADEAQEEHLLDMMRLAPAAQLKRLKVLDGAHALIQSQLFEMLTSKRRDAKAINALVNALTKLNREMREEWSRYMPQQPQEQSDLSVSDLPAGTQVSYVVPDNGRMGHG